MNIKQSVFILSALSIATLMTACSSGGSGGDGGQMPTTPLMPISTKPVVANTLVGDQLKSNAQDEVAHKLNANIVFHDYTANLDGVDYKDGKGINFQTFDKGHHQMALTETARGTSDGEQRTFERATTLHLFQQDYSMIAGVDTKRLTVKDTAGMVVQEYDKLDDFSLLVKGEPTQTLPSSGTYNYSGTGKFGIENDVILDGKVNYSVNFVNQTGSGKVTGLTGRTDIALQNGDIVLNDKHINLLDNSEVTTAVIRGRAVDGNGKDGAYFVRFFGPDAKEIVGEVDLDNSANLHGYFGATKQP